MFLLQVDLKVSPEDKPALRANFDKLFQVGCCCNGLPLSQLHTLTTFTAEYHLSTQPDMHACGAVASTGVLQLGEGSPAVLAQGTGMKATSAWCLRVLHVLASTAEQPNECSFINMPYCTAMVCHTIMCCLLHCRVSLPLLTPLLAQRKTAPTQQRSLLSRCLHQLLSHCSKWPMLTCRR